MHHGSMIYKEPLALGEVLEDWRLLNAMPLFKKGWKDKPRNYWPISPTSVMVKLLEGI